MAMRVIMRRRSVPGLFSVLMNGGRNQFATTICGNSSNDRSFEVQNFNGSLIAESFPVDVESNSRWRTLVEHKLVADPRTVVVCVHRVLGGERNALIIAPEDQKIFLELILQALGSFGKRFIHCHDFTNNLALSEDEECLEFWAFIEAGAVGQDLVESAGGVKFVVEIAGCLCKTGTGHEHSGEKDATFHRSQV